MKTREKSKTVYILGAGFSIEAGAPSQAQIMKCIFSDGNPNYSKMPDYVSFKKLLSEQMNYSPEQFESIQLEDIFTPLDRCIADNINFRGLNIPQVMAARESAFNMIGQAIRDKLNKEGNNKEYINLFAQHLVERSSKRSENKFREYDPVSVISTNWDILLDNSIYETIKQHHPEKAVVDYCCYISSLGEDDKTIMPGLEMLGSGGFNVKLIKLHGSLNWLQCPRCMRIYTGFGQKIGTEKNKPCRHCNKNFKEESDSHKLISNLIMPTFIKDLSNPQYKIIWQNAGVEISEADKIIFIGYSLPSADFEMKQLLSRMTKSDAEIIVVDYINENDDKEKIKTTLEETTKRWKGFFGRRKIKFDFQGASAFIINKLDTLNKDDFSN